MRIISGRFKSRQLKGTPPPGIRPTSDKLRETLFNVIGDTIIDATFLDACAGTGGIGLEALSRGAGFVYFVDQSSKSSRLIRQNVHSFGIEEGYKILEMGLGRSLDLLVRDNIVLDIAFIDPPYEREDLYQTALHRFSAGELLAAGGLLIIEHSKRVDLPDSVDRLCRVRSLVQGDSALAFYRMEKK